MKQKLITRTLYILSFIAFSFVPTGCKKLITIDPPISTISTEQVFSTDEQAKAAMAGAYTMLINSSLNSTTNSVYSGFAAGLATHLGAISSDEMIPFYGNDAFNMNKLTANTAYYGLVVWTSAYKVIYASNAVIEGVAAAKPGTLSDGVRKELTAEAKFIRAFCYFYLTNFFGDVPLALTVDFNQTANVSRTSRDGIYQQMIKDLTEAEAALANDFSYGNGQRIVPNKWAATAMLARIYLYQKDYTKAELKASEIINNQSQYGLVNELNGVFLVNSREAIWQLQQNSSITALGNATPEGTSSIPLIRGSFVSLSRYMASQLVNSFEPGDLRFQKWVNTISMTSSNNTPTVYYYPYKYKTGPNNFQVNAAPTEYYMVLRLAEQYLIRAEAEANGAGGGSAAAIADLNVLRKRADLDDLPESLNPGELANAILHERQTELFCEWGHRWFDLIRTGRAEDVLSVIPLKQPWLGAYQLLYPIPPSEIINNHRLGQNPGY